VIVYKPLLLETSNGALQYVKISTNFICGIFFIAEKYQIGGLRVDITHFFYQIVCGNHSVTVLCDVMFYHLYITLAAM
jgi:hypothetical protein